MISPALVDEVLGEVFALEEALGRKGFQSRAGQRLVTRMRQDLLFYFRRLERAIATLELERLAGIPEAHFIADRMLIPVLDALAPTLEKILFQNLEDAFVAGRIFAEKILATESEFIEQDHEAFEFASTRAALLIKDLNDTTRQRMRTAIAKGLRERLGTRGLGRLIRRTVLDMSRFRSVLIANTEMNQAVSFSSLQRFKRAGASFKTTIIRPKACPICVGNHAEGPIPIDQAFSSGHQHPPFHPACRDALVAAEAPES